MWGVDSFYVQSAHMYVCVWVCVDLGIIVEATNRRNQKQYMVGPRGSTRLHCVGERGGIPSHQNIFGYCRRKRSAVVAIRSQMPSPASTTHDERPMLANS